MRLFLKKVYLFVQAGLSQGLQLLTGTDTQHDDLAAAMTRDTGTDSQRSDPVAAPTIAIGTDTQSGPVVTTAASALTGTDTQAQDTIGVITAESQGTDSQAMGHTEVAVVPIGIDTQADTPAAATTLATGTDTESMPSFDAAQTRSTGADSQDDDPFTGQQSTIPIGTQTHDDDLSITGSATFPQGSDSQSMGGADLVTPATGIAFVADSSPNGFNGALRGTTPPASIVSPFSGFGRALDWSAASSNAAVDVGTAAGVGLGEATWTIELKCRGTALGAIRYAMSKWDAGGAATDQNFFLRIGSGVAGNDRPEFSIKLSDGSTHLITTGANEVVVGDNHIAVVYNPGVFMRVYLNGVQVGSSLPATTVRAPTAVNRFFIGALGSNGTNTPTQVYDSAIDEVRISNNVRYPTSGFTPPGTLTSDANTVALWHFDDTAQDIALDSSGNGRYGLLRGVPIPTNVVAPTSGYGRALQFNGVNDSGTLTNVQGVELVEFFPLTWSTGISFRGRFKHVATGVEQTLCQRWGSATAQRQWKVFINASNQLCFSYVNVTPAQINVVGATTLVDGQVYEFECSIGAQASSTARIFLDGVQDGNSGTSARGTVTDPTVPFFFGKMHTLSQGAPPYNPFAGTIEEFEVSDVQRHTATYTPGTPITPDANTWLLWRFDEATSSTTTTQLSAAGSTPLGTDSQSHSASASAQTEDFTDTATAVQNSGTGNWTNPTNAQGAFNGTEATHAGLTGLNTACSADVRCVGLVLPATPSGFTAGNYFIRIRHRWDLTITAPVAGVTDATHSVLITDNGGTQIGVAQLVRSAAVDGTTQATLITEDIDITSIVSEAQATAGIRVYCRAVCNYVPAVNGNTSWNVDAVHLVRAFTRTGIT